MSFCNILARKTKEKQMKPFLVAILLFSAQAYANSTDNVAALKMALDDEYKARATYVQVMNDFGKKRPFSKIVQSEQRHIEALLPFFEKYETQVPENPHLGNVPRYNSFKEACQAGVDAEVENVSLYDKIFAMTDDAELIGVFERLQWTSQNRHLPAFKRCVSRHD